MRIRKISQNEVTVYLSEQELGGYDIKPGEKVPEAASLHRFLFELMDTVYVETGFNPYGGQVVVEATPLQSGMSLTISKICSKKPLTRAEFKKVKNVRVKTDNAKMSEITDLSQNDILNIVEDIARRKLKREREKTDKRKGVFIFSEFTDMESALSVIPEDALGKCSLYRNKSRYAIVSDYKTDSRYYNMMSEFSENVVTAEIIADDIKEGWHPVAEGEALVKMAGVIREML